MGVLFMAFTDMKPVAKDSKSLVRGRLNKTQHSDEEDSCFHESLESSPLPVLVDAYWASIVLTYSHDIHTTL